ncbi:unnamed protein product [Chrysoparadoxa australica]
MPSPDLPSPDHEFDSTTLGITQALADAGKLWRCTTLDEVVGQFGYAPGDRIPRRDQVMIFKRLERAIVGKKAELVEAGNYVQIMQLDDTLEKLRHQFQDLQMRDARKDHAYQKNLFEVSQSITLSTRSDAQKKMLARQEGELVMDEAELAHIHMIQRENLDLELSWLPEPRVKYSKKFLELRKSEESLVRLRQYKDAQVVRKMMEKMRPVEEKKFMELREQGMERKKQLLLQRQQRDRDKLGMILTESQLHMRRQQAMQRYNLRSRISNGQKNMVHAHVKQLQRRPEMSVKPSAHWQTRANFHQTDAALRGEHLANAVKGPRTSAGIAVANLTDQHDFGSLTEGSSPLSGTMTTTQRALLY